MLQDITERPWWTAPYRYSAPDAEEVKVYCECCDRPLTDDEIERGICDRCLTEEDE